MGVGSGCEAVPCLRVSFPPCLLRSHRAACLTLILARLRQVGGVHTLVAVFLVNLDVKGCDGELEAAREGHAAVGVSEDPHWHAQQMQETATGQATLSGPLTGIATPKRCGPTQGRTTPQ